jgi:hypothetical protein
MDRVIAEVWSGHSITMDRVTAEVVGSATTSDRVKAEVVRQQRRRG